MVHELPIDPVEDRLEVVSLTWVLAIIIEHAEGGGEGGILAACHSVGVERGIRPLSKPTLRWSQPGLATGLGNFEQELGIYITQTSKNTKVTMLGYSCWQNMEKCHSTQKLVGCRLERHPGVPCIVLETCDKSVRSIYSRAQSRKLLSHLNVYGLIRSGSACFCLGREP